MTLKDEDPLLSEAIDVGIKNIRSHFTSGKMEFFLILDKTNYRIP